MTGTWRRSCPASWRTPAERDRLQHALDQSQRRLFQIAESISDGLYVLDRDWCYVYANARAAQLVQRSRAELIVHNVWQVFPDAVNLPFYAEAHWPMQDRVSVHFETFYAPPRHLV